MADLKLTITHYKVLDTLLYLNNKHLYPTEEGVFKIVSGVKDEDTKGHENSPTFSTLISYSSKKICHYCLALVRHDYVLRIYDKETDTLYLSITGKGRDSLLEYHEKHKNPYTKTIKKTKSSIIKIER